MSTESQPNSSERDNPSEREVESDFSIPEDADFTTPGSPMTDDEHRAEEAEKKGDGDDATPGNPLRS